VSNKIEKSRKRQGENGWLFPKGNMALLAKECSVAEGGRCGAGRTLVPGGDHRPIGGDASARGDGNNYTTMSSKPV
jgi:hypothetical protein